MIGKDFKNKPLSLKIILLFAFLQGGFGLLRAYNWVEIGFDLFGQGILLLPFVGTVAVMHGLFISIVGLLYVLFVFGALLGSSWAWWSCFIAVAVNLVLALIALVWGAASRDMLAWSAIPGILIFYLFSQTGREALKRA